LRFEPSISPSVKAQIFRKTQRDGATSSRHRAISYQYCVSDRISETTHLSTRRVVECIINYNYDEGASTNGKVKLTNKSQQSGLKVLIKLMTLRRLFQADDELDKSKE